MKKFIKSISIFLFLFISLLAGIFYVNNGTLRIDSERIKKGELFKKLEYFSEFINKNDSINIILGSSLIEASFIPDSLGTKWFSFTNSNQNIYESYKFIDYYKDSVKIDSIIIAIQPFDFPFSYVKNRKNNKPFLNGNFHIFGRDSITILEENNLLRNLQLLKQENYLDIDKIITKIKIHNSPNRVEDGLTRQGFLDRITRESRKGFDLDSFFLINPEYFNSHLNNFVNVKSPPNLFYFDLFESLTNSLGIKVIYLITPKSKYYHSGMKEMNYNKTWEEILNTLKTKPIELWDYEIMNTDNFDFYYFSDETHLSYEGAKSFTTMIRKRLYETSE